MKSKTLLLASITLFITIAFTLNWASGSDKSKSLSRAKKNDKVWIILNHVKADKCEQFEKFVHEIFLPSSKNPSATKLSAEDMKAFEGTRILHPSEKAKDGTYTYAFIVDPVIEGYDYSIENILLKKYGKEKGEEYMKMFNECFASNQKSWVLVQVSN